MIRESQPVDVSLVIPAFNERSRIGRTLERALGFLRSQVYSFEIIIVDDGSWDGTGSLVKERFGNDGSVRIYRQEYNMGKGEAVRRGMLLGSGEYVFFSDADLSVPMEMLPRFLDQLEKEADLAIGTRQNAGAEIEVHQPRHREFMGKTYTWLSNRILGLGVSDITCGFKGFRKTVARDLFSRQRLRNWSFDAEVLYLARRRGYRILEVPVRWRDHQGTKVRLGRDIWTSFWALFQIRLLDSRGKYR